MIAFLDTSVLVATFYTHHQRHAASMDLFLRHPKHEACCGAHTLAEVYASLTGMPGQDRVKSDDALLFLGSIREHLTIISLTDEEYFRLIRASARVGVTGGGIYDAILAHCALKVDAERIYTWNVKHFMRLGSEIAGRVATP